MKIRTKIQEIVVPQINLARALNLTPQRITQLIDENVVIRADGDKSGGVLLFDSVKNYYSAKRKKGDGESLDFWEEKAKHEKVKREIAEVKLAKLEGSVYDAATVELAIIEMLTVCKTKILGLPAKLATQLTDKTPGEINDILTAELEECLKELSEYNTDVFKEEVEGFEDEETSD